MSELRRKADGWPLCPRCGEDELADLVNLYARDDGDLFCYRCAAVTVRAGRPLVIERRPIRTRRRAW